MLQVTSTGHSCQCHVHRAVFMGINYMVIEKMFRSVPEGIGFMPLFERISSYL